MSEAFSEIVDAVSPIIFRENDIPSDEIKERFVRAFTDAAIEIYLSLAQIIDDEDIRKALTRKHYDMLIEGLGIYADDTPYEDEGQGLNPELAIWCHMAQRFERCARRHRLYSFLGRRKRNMPVFFLQQNSLIRRSFSIRPRTPRRSRHAVAVASRGGGDDGGGGEDGPGQSDPSDRLRTVFEVLSVIILLPDTDKSRWSLRLWRNGSVRVLRHRMLAPLLCAHGVAGPPVASHLLVA